MKNPKRNPSGLATKKPIALRLMPGELADAQRIAGERKVSCSKLARQAYLLGLPLVLNAASVNNDSALNQA